MTTVKPTSLFPPLNDPNINGIKILPDIPNRIAPKPDGNNSLPPRTNIDDPPAAFQDDITSSGGGPDVIPADPRNPYIRRINNWIKDHTTTILMMGIVLFSVMAVYH